MSKYQAALFTVDGDGDKHAQKLVDIHDIRLKKMDEQGVEFNILSLTAPGIQVSAFASYTSLRTISNRSQALHSHR